MAKFWSSLDDFKVRCDLCPRSCVLKKGAIGFCSIRGNIDGELVELSKNTLHAIALDPIEKKPFNHFYPGGDVLSVGTVGCNLACRCCQNWNLSQSEMRSGDKILPSDLVELALDRNVMGIAYTYNEPIVFAEYVMETARLAREKGLKNVVVSAGYITDGARESFFKNIDAANIDLKSFNEKTYRSHCQGELEVVLDTLRYLKENAWLEITTLIIPGLNDSEVEIDKMTKWITRELGCDVPIHFSAFSPNHKMQGTKSTSIETLIKAKEIAQANGINYIYLGNVAYQNDIDCPLCGQKIIQRCDCGYHIAGHF